MREKTHRFLNATLTGARMILSAVLALHWLPVIPPPEVWQLPISESWPLVASQISLHWLALLWLYVLLFKASGRIVFWFEGLLFRFLMLRATSDSSGS